MIAARDEMRRAFPIRSIQRHEKLQWWSLVIIGSISSDAPVQEPLKRDVRKAPISYI
jgi:hypothetical protein